MLRLAVIGAPRSGTRYLAALLDAAGVYAGHEVSTVGPAGVHLPSLKLLTVDVSWLLVPHVAELRRLGLEVALLSRHPLRVLPSMFRRGFLDPRRTASTNAYALHHCPELEACPAAAGLERAARFWLAWNRRAIAAGEVLRVRVEALDAAALIVLGRLAGVELERWQAERALERVPRDMNTAGPTRELTWGGLGRVVGGELAVEVLELAQELGHPDEAPARPSGCAERRTRP